MDAIPDGLGWRRHDRRLVPSWVPALRRAFLSRNDRLGVHASLQPAIPAAYGDRRGGQFAGGIETIRLHLPYVAMRLDAA